MHVRSGNLNNTILSHTALIFQTQRDLKSFLGNNPLAAISSGWNDFPSSLRKYL